MAGSRPLDAINKALVRRAVSGDAGALDKILSAAMRPFYNLALRMLQNHEDAEDATQEALIRVATKLDRFRGDAKFSTWAFTIATRCVLDFANGRARRANLTAKEFAADLQTGLSPTASSDPEAALMASQVKLGCCRAMLQVLGGDLRIAYVLGEILGLEQAEAAAAIGVSPAAFRQRLTRARARLRAVLKSNCGIYEPANACRCSARVAPALALGRLAPRDADIGPGARRGARQVARRGARQVARQGAEQGAEGARHLDVKSLGERVRKLDEFARAAAIFQADPQVSASERLLPRVRAVFGYG
ncbi:MAG: RNA polymerase sigma factor [Alphaproteobacteria bacterium]|nr:RNA polymerase sigma factor [Alphaproteobacteria bacterium]